TRAIPPSRHRLSRPILLDGAGPGPLGQQVRVSREAGPVHGVEPPDQAVHLLPDGGEIGTDPAQALLSLLAARERGLEAIEVAREPGEQVPAHSVMNEERLV